MHDGALDHALEAQVGWVSTSSVPATWGVLSDETTTATRRSSMLAEQARNLGAPAGVVQQRQQQVFDRDELMALLPGLDEGHMQADFNVHGQSCERPLWGDFKL